ncbi:MAG: DUF2786 domain-containing protein [Bacteroidetes bacterium]|nr:MAG: DUF2786 domain-containing protein [Bacteroidota bacterium]
MPENIVEKIKKLLALSSSPNQHEAELALSRAYELMEKYNISMGDLKEKEPFETVRAKDGERAHPEDSYIFMLLKEYFHVIIVLHVGNRKYTGNIFSVLGEPHNIIIAKHVYEFLRRTFTSLWKANKHEFVSSRMGGARKNRIKESYFFGLYAGLNKKLDEARKALYQGYGLIRVDNAALERYYKEQFPNAKSSSEKIKLGDKDAFSQGFVDGEKIEIFKPLQSANNNFMLLPQ